jgi:carboxyl-terminal processing protease
MWYEMVFLKKISVQLLSVIFLFSSSGCVYEKDTIVVDKYIKHKYIKEQASLKHMDKYSKILDENKSLKLRDALEQNKHSVYSMRLRENIVYIKVHTFANNTAKDIQKICADTSVKEGMILDLRNNGGGYLSEAIALVDLFLDDGVIAIETGRGEIHSTIYKAHNKSVCQDIPLVILINKKSASASEIVSGAMQIYKKAILVGTPTYGKGTIQELISLSGNRILKLTVSKYRLANNQNIENIGVKPDITIQGSQIDFTPRNIQISEQVKKDIKSQLKDKKMISYCR